LHSGLPPEHLNENQNSRHNITARKYLAVIVPAQRTKTSDDFFMDKQDKCMTHQTLSLMQMQDMNSPISCSHFLWISL